MPGEFLFRLNEALLAGLMLLLLLGAVEVGHRAGMKVSSRSSDQAKSQVNAISASVLALLALLLGFTFAMALSRYDLRKQLVINEANAIGTTYLRSRLLPEPERTEYAALLRDYVDARLELFYSGMDQERINAILEKTGRLQGELWSRVPTAVEKDPRPTTTGLFISSLNETIDLDAERLAAAENHLPEPILILLFFVAVLSVFGVGYATGLTKSRQVFATTIQTVLLVLVMIAILDLDRPRRGLITVNQNPMIRLRESLKMDASK